MSNCYSKWFIASIHQIFFLTKLFLFSCSAHCFLISILKLLILIICHYKTSLIFFAFWVHILAVSLI